MTTFKHPLANMAEQIERVGLAVLENVTDMPVYGEPYISPYLVIALNHSGWLRAEYDMHPVEFRRHETAIIFPNHILYAHEVSPDYRATLLVISARFLEYIKQMHPAHYHVEYHYNTSFKLNGFQFDSIYTCFRLLNSISQLKHPKRDELMAEQMDILADMTETFIRENGAMTLQDEQPVQQLLSRFHRAIAIHYRESREVRFYAEQLCLSPKYFGRVIRQATGIGAGEWIARYVIIQSKYLLRQHPEMTIQQISDELGFSDQTAFTRYFRTYTQITPKEYRELKKVES
ncbi:MAG: AraC family transcriptional regulator [Bacteroidaceae bacterium]|nr:AraC family transcriptional regulator [Bacteroidaceae bacterium]